MPSIPALREREKLLRCIERLESTIDEHLVEDLKSAFMVLQQRKEYHPTLEELYIDVLRANHLYRRSDVQRVLDDLAIRGLVDRHGDDQYRYGVDVATIKNILRR